MSIQSIYENIENRHDPENDIIPGMDRRVSWAEAELAGAVSLLLKRIENLEERLSRLTDRVDPTNYRDSR